MRSPRGCRSRGARKVARRARRAPRKSLARLRELYGWLEETVDACREVAQVISGIILKGT
jgi:uncharacterized protein Yka (UPF0111/DUF47 family)